MDWSILINTLDKDAVKELIPNIGMRTKVTNYLRSVSTVVINDSDEIQSNISNEYREPNISNAHLETPSDVPYQCDVPSNNTMNIVRSDQLVTVTPKHEISSSHQDSRINQRHFRSYLTECCSTFN